MSPSVVGGFGANQHLRQSMVFLDVPTMQQPKAYMGGRSAIFNEKGEISKEETLKYLRKFMDTFATWVETNSRH